MNISLKIECIECGDWIDKDSEDEVICRSCVDRLIEEEYEKGYEAGTKDANED